MSWGSGRRIVGADAEPGDSKYVFNQDLNIARCRLAVLRGKVVMTFASEFHKNFRIADGFCRFTGTVGARAISPG